jgi:hypothetical protein
VVVAGCTLRIIDPLRRRLFTRGEKCKNLTCSARKFSVNRRFQFQERSQLFSSTRLWAPLRDQTHRERVYRPLQFYECSQLFIGTHDETLSVAMRLHNPDRSAFKVNC